MIYNFHDLCQSSHYARIVPDFGLKPDRNFGCQTTFQDARIIENWHPGCQPGHTDVRNGVRSKSKTKLNSLNPILLTCMLDASCCYCLEARTRGELLAATSAYIHWTAASAYVLAAATA